MTIERAEKFIKENKHKVNNEFRLKFHFMPEVGWMNDPNGLVFYKGKYHIFYQHYPYNSVWGDMHWGHAVSSDLVRYEYAPIALAPDQKDETGCFSGGAIVDKNNPELLHLFYTKHYEKEGEIIETQGFASSEDGIHFDKLDKPIIDSKMIEGYAKKSDFRDPIPYYKNGVYYVIVGTQNEANEGRFVVFKTKDLQNYTFHDYFDGHEIFGTMAECPNLIDIEESNVLLFSKIKYIDSSDKNINGSHYTIGNIDLENKTYDFDKFRDIDSGYHFYAPQTLKDDKGRTIMIAWMEMWGRKQVTHDLGHFWQGSLTFPRELKVVNDILYQWPIEEIEQYYITKQELVNNHLINKQSDLFIEETSSPFSIKLHSIVNHNEYFEFGFNGSKVYIDGTTLFKDSFEMKESIYKYKSVSARILIDTSSVEIFVNNGKEAFTVRVYIEGNNYLFTSTKRVKGYFFNLNMEEYV
jgi:beta-fructofuranosidase